jgi:hypothetical protein
MHEQNPSQHDEIGSKKQMNNVEVAKLYHSTSTNDIFTEK